MKTYPLIAVFCALVASLLLTTLISVSAVETAVAHRLRHSDQEVAQAIAINLSRQQVSMADAQALIDAHFALGAYTRIRLMDADGKNIYARELTDKNTHASSPDTHLFWVWELKPRDQIVPATAKVKSSPHGIAHVSVQSHLVFDHVASEKWLLQLLGASAGLMLLTGAALLVLLRRDARALGLLEQGLNGLRQFQWVQLPTSPDPRLSGLYSQFNDISNLLNERMNRTAEQLEQLNRMRRHDETTGLLNRRAFEAMLDQHIESLDPGGTHSLLVLRARNLAELNRARGRSHVDQSLKQLGSCLLAFQRDRRILSCARSSGSDFLVLPDPHHPAANLLSELTGELLATGLLLDSSELPLNASDVAQHLMSRCDAFEQLPQQPGRLPDTKQDEQSWDARIDHALLHHRFFLQGFRVEDRLGRLVHQEYYVRLLEKSSQQVLTGAAIMPWAERLRRAADIDFEVLNLAINRAIEDEAAVCINLSQACLADPQRRQMVLDVMEEAWRYAAKLRLDIPETFAFSDPQTLQAWSAAVRRLGAEVGIGPLDQFAGQLLRLRSCDLSYIKVAASLLDDLLVPEKAAHCERLLATLVQTAHDLKLQVFAEGVQNIAQKEVLFRLDFDGATGPAIG